LDSTDSNGDLISKWCKRTSESHVIICCWCNATLNLVSKGLNAVKQHVLGTKHKQKRRIAMEIQNFESGSGSEEASMGLNSPPISSEHIEWVTVKDELDNDGVSELSFESYEEPLVTAEALQTSKKRKLSVPDDLPSSKHCCKSLTHTEHFCISLATHLDQLSSLNRLETMTRLQQVLTRALKDEKGISK